MFPLKDHYRTSKLALITYLLITLNVIVFVFEIFAPEPDLFIETYALIPQFVNFKNLESLYPFITSQFLHAGFLHIISNMWFLRIFGDNVEERFGHIKYLIVYLLSGIVGGLIQHLFTPDSDIPMLGASGAVAGVLGAYLVFFPKHQIETLIPFGLFSRIVNIPASFMLVYWFVIQLFSGVGSIAYINTGGVAFWAHIGGFACGWLIAKFYKGDIIGIVEEGEEGEILDI